MKCGAELTESAYCPKCGCDVSVQKQAIVLSGVYYNQGLEKAQIRDLSGAIDQLKRSLKFNKLNIDARNLLGLAYFETGEVVAALSEWVISKNIQPEGNIAAEYIRNLQQDANRLDLINQTIKKYNIALDNCLRGNEDVAMIQLKKILAQNPKLIKAYHLLSLLHIHREEYEKARRLLKKAIQIDKTNTTTLRFLQEIDEQTGKATQFESRFPLRGGRRGEEEKDPEYISREIRQVAVYKPGHSRLSIFSVILGMLIGAAAIWFLFIPSRMRAINREANEKISKYSSDMAVYAAQIQTMNEQIDASEQTVTTANEQIDSANTKAQSYDNLIKAMNGFRDETYTTAANALAAVNTDDLSVDAKATYDYLLNEMASSMTSAFKKAGIDFFNTGNYDLAIQKLTASLETNDEDYEAISYLAHAYRMKNDTEKADELFQRIIDENPGTQQAENARQYLSANQPAQTAQAEGQNAAGEDAANAADGDGEGLAEPSAAANAAGNSGNAGAAGSAAGDANVGADTAEDTAENTDAAADEGGEENQENSDNNTEDEENYNEEDEEYYDEDEE